MVSKTLPAHTSRETANSPRSKFPMQAAEVRLQVCGQVLSYESPFGLGGWISGCAVSFDWLTRGASVVGPREPDCSDSMPAFAL